jgi:hypothetical protein
MTRRFRCKRYVVKGREYVYYRKGRARIRAPWGSPAFAQEFAELEASAGKVEICGTEAAKLAQAYDQFRLTEQYQKLPLRTRAAYHVVFEWLAAAITMPVAAVNAALVRQLRDKAHRDRGYRFANFVLAFFLHVVAHAVENGQLRQDQIAGRISKIPRPKSTAPSSRSWTVAPRDAANWGPKKS